MSQSRRTYRCNTTAIERTRASRGISLQSLADRSRLSLRTVKRILGGKAAYIETISSIASALDVTCDELIQRDIEVLAPRSTGDGIDPRSFEVTVTIRGRIPDGVDSATSFDVSQTVSNAIRATGLQILSANQDTKIGDTFWKLVVVHDELEEHGACWACVAVHNHALDRFMKAHEEGKLDWPNFDEYGKLITWDKEATTSHEDVKYLAELAVEAQTRPLRE